MKETAGNPEARKLQEQTLIVNIDLTRGLVVALLVIAAVVAVALLVRGPAPAQRARVVRASTLSRLPR